MQSRRDQVQAYFFVVGRLVSAVTTGRPDALQSPYRRLNTGTVFGVLLAAVLMAVFGIYGLFKPGGDNTWRQDGAIVMDKSTGTRYVFLGGQLRPVLNYASARLATGGGGEVKSVSRNSLGDTPVGQPIGIMGAPDMIPGADKLDRGPWTVCVAPGASPQAGPRVTVLIGGPTRPGLTEGQALLVSTPDGSTHLVWQGKRHRVGDRAVLDTLGYGDTHPLPVSAAWLNPLEQGRDIAAPATPGTGQTGPRIDGEAAVVGQVFRVRNPAIDSDQLYLLRADGVTPLSPTTAALLLAAPDTKRAYPSGPVAPIEVGPAALQGIATSPGVDLVSGLPPRPPDLVTPPRGAQACVRYGPNGTGDMDVAVAVLPAAEVDAKAVPAAPHEAGTMADRTAVPTGGGVLARDLPAPGAAPGALHLITETGVRYPIADADALAALGYGEDAAVPVPASLLALLPSGPLLSTQTALQVSGP
ncbi:type VII secretion protein EccB [Actinokineospora pegani]|uniref:type VII secretion protein EccB n=1 Tax=Actinokineospora pegani TaxID=2654637 RepID=UPI0012EAF738|nr:type VII secretion protein EccB [Actinokineospora pegani]